MSECGKSHKDAFAFFIGFSVRIIGLVVMDGKFLQEYPVNAGVPQGSIVGPTISLV